MGNSKSNELTLSQALVEDGLVSTGAKDTAKPKLTKLHWGIIITSFLVAVAIGIAYGIVIPEIEQRVEDANKVCSSSDPGADLYKDPSTQDFSLYFFNITNPAQVLQGAQHEVHELGAYGFSFKNHRYSIDYNEHDHTVSVDDWYLICPFVTTYFRICSNHLNLCWYIKGRNNL